MLPGADYFIILCWDAIFVFSKKTLILQRFACPSPEIPRNALRAVVFKYFRFHQRSIEILKDRTSIICFIQF